MFLGTLLINIVNKVNLNNYCKTNLRIISNYIALIVLDGKAAYAGKKDGEKRN